MTKPIAVLLEEGAKRTFAVAVEWPGWARSGRDADGALRALGDYRERYAGILRAADVGPPATAAGLEVVARVGGGSGTDFGVPSVAIPADGEPLAGADLDRKIRILTAAWGAFDRAAAAATGVELSRGPRGGGRGLAEIAAHVTDAERVYIGQIGAPPPQLPSDPTAALRAVHAACLDALRAKSRGELPEVGVRGGRRWSARYFVRRTAWHVIDHAWEIEDRASGGGGPE